MQGFDLSATHTLLSQPHFQPNNFLLQFLNIFFHGIEHKLRVGVKRAIVPKITVRIVAMMISAVFNILRRYLYLCNRFQIRYSFI